MFRVIPQAIFGFYGQKEIGGFLMGRNFSWAVEGEVAQDFIFWMEEVFCYSLIDIVNFVDSLFLGL